ncbi:hypothetical protein [Roseibium sp. TrichSKD4]|uniref:hypothetical protein n=1 Tax=Roseibium sp. TrichSKD4 TaxID=744980 RepID=UPI00058AC7DE|nr:hypothetical protein [Roseibium sp. TrichSKD4]
MTYLTSYIRGYRRALRDAVVGADMFGHMLRRSGRGSGGSADHTSADEIGMFLRAYRDHGEQGHSGKVRTWSDVFATSQRLDRDERFRVSEHGTSSSARYRLGYGAGLSYAAILLTQYAWSMNEAESRFAILTLVLEIERLRADLDREESEHAHCRCFRMRRASWSLRLEAAFSGSRPTS